jgi:hypothetical protein
MSYDDQIKAPAGRNKNGGDLLYATHDDGNDGQDAVYATEDGMDPFFDEPVHHRVV